MHKDITQLLKEATKDILSEESLAQIEEAFNQKVEERAKLQVEAALAKQDEEYSLKLEQLIKTLDADHTAKLVRVVEAQDYNNYKKLQAVVKRYSKIINEQARAFKNNMINHLSKYLEVYLDKAIPQDLVEEAVINKKASLILNNLRRSLAVNAVLAKESIRDAVLDGKQQLDEALEKLTKTERKLKIVQEQADKAAAELLLEKKIAKLPEKKQEYVRNVLKGKSVQFIKENLDYTLSLYENKIESHRENLKKEAIKTRVAKEDSILNESTEINLHRPTLQSEFTSSYLDELRKY